MEWCLKSKVKTVKCIQTSSYETGNKQINGSIHTVQSSQVEIGQVQQWVCKSTLSKTHGWLHNTTLHLS